MLRKMRRNGPAAAHEMADAAAIEHFASVARSHAGAVRELNEDRYVNLPDRCLWAVADGMGGHRAGDHAAQLTADALSALGGAGASPAPAAIHQAVEAVNNELFLPVQKRGSEATSGSTLVALIAGKGRYTCLWAGDSRAYRLRAGMLVAISRDHSLVQEMVDAGILSSAEARAHPRSNVITRAIGVADPLRLEAATGRIIPGDRFLLCSDGLTGALDEAEILALLQEPNLDAAADGLLAAALDRLARDNVTFVLIEPRA